MADFTVADGGGNINAGATYVGGVAPSSTDSIIFTATSGQLTVNTTFTISGFNLTNYTNTITFTALLNVSGNLNLGTGGYTQAGANGIVKTGTGSITSNGTTWSRFLKFQGTITVTLNDDLNLSGAITFQVNSNPDITTLNGFNIYHTGTFIAGANGGIINGTTKYYYTGTGTTYALGTSFNQIGIDFYLNGSGNFAITGTSTTGIYFTGNTKEFKVITGTLVTSGLSALTIGGRIVDFGGSTVNNLRLVNVTQTVTLLSNTTVTTLSIVQSASVTHTINGFTLSASTITQTTGTSTAIAAGTTNIDIVGTGSWTNSATGILRNNVTFKPTAITTVSGTIYYNTGTLAAESGCSVTTTGSTLNIGASTTLNTDGFVTWNNVSVSAAATITLNSTLSGSTLTLPNANVTFSGIGGFTFNAITSSTLTASRIFTLTANNTYILNTSISLIGTSTGTRSSIVSSSGTDKATLKLSYSGTQNIQNMNVTRIDSTVGQPLMTSWGTLTDTLHWGIGMGTMF